jgi:hypothetical protein
MAHFSEQTWADFVRGIGTDATMREVQTHLASACPECKSDFDLWGRVVRLVAKENDYAPPDSLVQALKAEFPAAQAVELEPWTMTSILFDSASAPLPVGIRGSAASTRQLVYEGEGLTVDVRFERRQHSKTISVSGQVLDKEVPLRWLGKAAIVLWNDKGQTVARTEAGEYGEFQFDFEPQGQLRISIATADRRTLRIPLGNLE